jgi:hypothetical protein
MIQEILIPIVLKIQRAIRYWIYKRKYLPYLRIKRQRDRDNEVSNNILSMIQKESLPLAGFESWKLNRHIGFQLNLQMMPRYFINLGEQANKQLNEDDVKSIIKSRCICEELLENSADLHSVEIKEQARAIRTESLL